MNVLFYSLGVNKCGESEVAGFTQTSWFSLVVLSLKPPISFNVTHFTSVTQLKL